MSPRDQSTRRQTGTRPKSEPPATRDCRQRTNSNEKSVFARGVDADSANHSAQAVTFELFRLLAVVGELGALGRLAFALIFREGALVRRGCERFQRH